jgi:Predicted signal transduction protein with a C-terminal ATPase domain
MNRFVSMRVQFIVMFVLLITIPYLVSGTVTYSEYSAVTKKNANAYALQIMNQIRINLETVIAEANRITIAPLYDEDVLDIMDRHGSDVSAEGQLIPSTEITKMARVASSLTLGRPAIERMLFFTRDGIIYSAIENSLNRFWREADKAWMERVNEAEGGLVIIGPHQPSYSGKRVISAARVLNHPATGRNIGIVKIDFRMEDLEDILSGVWLSEHSILFVRNDADGALLFPDKFDTFPEVPVGGNTIKWNGEHYLYASLKSRATGLTLFGLMPVSDLQRGAKDVVRTMAAISVISLLAAYLLAIATSDRLVKPIRYLKSRMRLVQSGLLHERADLGKMRRDEIGQLAQGFNVMVAEVERLVKEVYETKLREREAELSALQSQINPHFLYNTLELINTQALKGEQLQVTGIVASLGKMLRYTVDKQERPVQLRDEILFAGAYLQIQAMRHSDRLRSEMYIDPSFESCLVPKLILQPLVENAIEHGMVHGAEARPLTITVKASAVGDDLLLTVQDDGAGMSEERLRDVEEQMTKGLTWEGERLQFGDRQKGFAVRNIHQQIRLLYGEGYGLRVASRVNEGTRWDIRLPMRWEEASDV